MSEAAPFELRTEHISIIRQNRRLLKEVSLTIPQGKISLILGHNGAGKTLLMQVLHGLITPSEGRVYSPERHRQKMVFQKPIMLRRTASQHFDFICPGLKEDEKQDWFARASIVGRMNTPARLLSGGEQQKLALIGALASKPRLLFLDEPAANLDFEATSFVEEMVSWSRQQGTTIVMISHNRGQAQRLADHIFMMDRGRLMEHSPAKAFFKSPNSKAGKTYLDFA